MNDDWSDLEQVYKQKEQNMPDIVARARKDIVRFRIGTGIFFVIVALQLANVLRHIARHPSDVALASDVLTLCFCVALASGVVWSFRGSWTQRAAEPVAMLDELERRQRGRLRLRGVIAITAAGLFTGVVVLGFVAGAPAPAIASVLAGTTLIVLVDRLASRKIRKHLREIEAARALLRDDAS